jgi:adenosine phosphosulfate reductase beta subunit
MPSYVNPEKCDGCKALDKTACQYICPNDLMALDKEKMKAYNRDVSMCWECYNCVKICPTQAIEIRGYAEFVPLGASVTPLRSTDSIMCRLRIASGPRRLPSWAAKVPGWLRQPGNARSINASRALRPCCRRPRQSR